MGNENQPCTLGDYSRPSNEGYQNTIELPEGDNVSSLRSDTIRLVQNGCAFHRLRSEDPKKHLKDFLKLVDLLDLNGANKERTHLQWRRIRVKNVTKLSIKKVVEQSEVLKEEDIEEHVENDESDRSRNEDPPGWGKYVDRLMKMPRSRPIGYYLKHKINKKTIEDLVDNHKYNDALLTTRLGKIDSEIYKSLPIEPMYDAILKNKLARNKGGEGNFVIACSIGKLKYMNALGDQGSDMNIMPLTIYNKLTSEKPIGTNIRLSLANYSYVYLVGIMKDVLADVAGFVYPVDFMILDVNEDDYMPLILGTLFITMARAEIKCCKGSMTLRAKKFEVRFVMTLRFHSKVKDRKKSDLDPMILTNYVNRRVLE
ncbi:zinc finger, CCHC-type containing protein [Tanacetum coccineum]|uniref:Zinc finger, CCHC-type containing protein n=1 Tax=Tanacetum coccineum TaxID=301880 RepID=A0ABQ5AWU7_9ASTR